jgi:hypothetical protein
MPWPAGNAVQSAGTLSAMEIELHQVELRYAALRRRDAKRERALR